MNPHPSSPKIVGIGGGIGSGKSTVCKILEILRVPVYYSDARARFLMENDTELIESIKRLFGEQAYIEKKLNAPFISGKVFSSSELLQKLNAIVHPAVAIDNEKWVKKHGDQVYLAKESALLFETGIYQQSNYNVLVVSPLNLRISRIQERDGLTTQQILDGIDKQWTDEVKMKLADEIIHNDTIHSLIEQTWSIHHKIIDLWKK